MAETNRMLPPLDEVTTPYWTGGRDGELRIEFCEPCATYQHPPLGECLQCGGTPTTRAVSGRGTVFSFTINVQPFHPEVEVPYVLALVELIEQAGLVVPTTIVGCDPATVAIDQPVRVVFEPAGPAWIPQFTPEDGR